ncbi:hypothetical protein [Clostridium ljungdahlii]|uniref:hypothetical protein n=1 Tax=Clostridium ljungdahlii TaxID=1538 RepID=UPI003869730D
MSVLDINKDKSFVEGEGVSANENQRKKILKKDKERLFLKESSLKASNLINNEFFEEDTGKLRTYLTNSLDRNNNTNTTIKGLIDKYISNGNGIALKEKLFTVMEWDTNLQIINNEWETIETFRNIVAHNNIIFNCEYKNISSTMINVNKAIISSFIGLLNQFYGLAINIDINKQKLKINWKNNNDGKTEIEYEDVNCMSEDSQYKALIIYIDTVFRLNLNKNIIFFNNEVLNDVIGNKDVVDPYTKENFINGIQEIFKNILITEGQNNRHYLENQIDQIMTQIEYKWNN